MPDIKINNRTTTRTNFKDNGLSVQLPPSEVRPFQYDQFGNQGAYANLCKILMTEGAITTQTQTHLINRRLAKQANSRGYTPASKAIEVLEDYFTQIGLDLDPAKIKSAIDATFRNTTGGHP
jgi:hypothetical protein